MAADALPPPPASPLYRAVSEETKALVGDLNRRKVPIFALPALFVTPEAAHVASMLDALFRAAFSTHRRPAYRTFFSSSRYEAIDGVIKLLRHRARASFAHHGGHVVVLDPKRELEHRLDPLRSGPANALVPGVLLRATSQEVERVLAERPVCGVIVREALAHDQARVRSLARAARTYSARVAVDLSDSDLSARELDHVAPLSPDILITGERLTDYEIPFAAFTGTFDVFAPWASRDAFIHSSTYGGNTLSLAKVKAGLLRNFEPGNRVHGPSAAGDDRWDSVLRVYGELVNPAGAKLHRTLSGGLHVVRAEGATVTVQLDSGQRLDLVDAISGGGLGTGGHNPDDVCTDVLAGHDPDADYFQRLQQTLGAQSGLPRAFPGVSGAGAVDTAMCLALLAQGGRRTVLVFRGNYAGKTLPALLATANARTRAPFEPLYPDVRYLDPFAPDAVKRLEEELARKDLALVWLEWVHGSAPSYAPIPDALLTLIAREREERGYLVGVDEILTSYYRCGQRFAFMGRLPHVDVVTLSKALSYLTFPVSVTLTSEAVHARAAQANARAVAFFETRLRSALGAHFGLHSITQLESAGIPARAEEMSARLRQAFARIGPRRTGFRRYLVEGLFVRLETPPPRSLALLGEAGRDFYAAALTLWWITKAGVFNPADCFGLPLTASAAEADRIVEGIEELAATAPHEIVRHSVTWLVKQRIARMAGMARSIGASVIREGAGGRA